MALVIISIVCRKDSGWSEFPGNRLFGFVIDQLTPETTALLDTCNGKIVQWQDTVDEPHPKSVVAYEATNALLTKFDQDIAFDSVLHNPDNERGHMVCMPKHIDGAFRIVNIFWKI